MDDDGEFGERSVGHNEPRRLSDEELFGPNAPPGVLPLPEPPRTADRIPSKYRKSAGASLLAAGMLGLRDIIEPPKDLEDLPVAPARRPESLDPAEDPFADSDLPVDI